MHLRAFRLVIIRRQEPVSLARDPATLGLFVTSHALAALLVRDEGVAGSNPATPTSFLTIEAVTGNDMGNETVAQRKHFAPIDRCRSS